MSEQNDSRKWWVLLTVGTGTFMSALDASIVNTILPVLRTDLSSNVATIQWVVTVYLLTVSGLLLPLGRLGDLRGHKRTYITGMVLFAISSAFCGQAGTPGQLIAARGLQALGGAMLFASSPAILTSHFPARQRGQALGIQAMMTYLGLTLGPSVGGWIAGTMGWRVVFYLNIPVCIAALALCLAYVPTSIPAGRAEPFDPPGAGLFMSGLVMLLLGLNRGHDWGWGSLGVVGLLAGSAALLTGFLLWQRRAAHPMLDLTLFQSRLFSLCVISALMNYAAIYSITFLLPFYLIDGRGMGPERAGLILSIQPVIMAAAAPISGTLSDRLGPRQLSTLGMAILVIGMTVLACLDAASSMTLVGVGLGLTGLGTGIFIAPNNSAMMGAAPPHRQGIAAGVLATSRNVGMVLGVGLAGAIYTTVLAHAAEGALFAGVRAGLLAGAAVAAVGCVTAAMRAEPGRGTAG